MIQPNTRFGKWTVVAIAVLRPQAKYLVRCECGREEVRYGHSLTRRNNASTGCSSCHIRKSNFVHGMRFTPEYYTYCGAKQRCTNPKAEHYADYGGRGILFRFSSFREWFAALGTRPSDLHSVDRIDVNGHYEPGNLRWATGSEQAFNRRKRKKRVSISA